MKWLCGLTGGGRDDIREVGKRAMWPTRWSRHPLCDKQKTTQAPGVWPRPRPGPQRDRLFLPGVPSRTCRTCRAVKQASSSRIAPQFKSLSFLFTIRGSSLMDRLSKHKHPLLRNLSFLQKHSLFSQHSDRRSSNGLCVYLSSLVSICLCCL